MDWESKFVEKEFLSHVLTPLFYTMGGEVGVKILIIYLDLEPARIQTLWSTNLDKTRYIANVSPRQPGAF